MPNTLAHLGLQPLLTRLGMPQADLKWIWAACILPDLPWIAQRLVRAALPDISGFDLRLYATIQSSLSVTLVLAAALALMSRDRLNVFVVLASGALLHLLLDATQIKWANGVLLFAPVTWEMTSFNLYWPESPITHVLTAFGACFVLWAVWHERPVGIRPVAVDPRAVGLGAMCLAAYLFAPFAFFDAAERANLHFVATLRDVPSRPGQAIELDRTAIVWEAGEPIARLSMGPELRLIGDVPPGVARASIRGTFLDTHTVAVLDLHAHPADWRAAMSLLGLGVVAWWWLAACLRPRR